jgi:hypothetical protein
MITVSLPRVFLSLPGIRFLGLFNGKPDVSKPGDDSQPQSDEKKPGVGAEFVVQPIPEPESDKDRERYRKTEAAVKCQVPNRSTRFSFQEERCPFKFLSIFMKIIDEGK